MRFRGVVRDKLTGLAHRMGRRGFTLTFLGLLDIAIAFNLMSPEARTVPSYVVFSRLAPLTVYALVWLTIGLICLSQVFATNDRFAFTCAVGLKVAWAMEYGMAEWIYGVTRSWVGAVIWLGAAALVFVISTWPEEPR